MSPSLAIPPKTCYSRLNPTDHGLSFRRLGLVCCSVERGVLSMIYAKWVFNTILLTFLVFAFTGCRVKVKNKGPLGEQEVEGEVDPKKGTEVEVEGEVDEFGRLKKVKGKLKR